MTILLFAILFLILSALFSGSEIGFISANKLKVEIKTQKSGRKGKVFKSFFDDPQEFIASMLVGNNIALVVFTYLVSKMLSPFLEGMIEQDFLVLLLITVLTTIVVLLFGEYIPKTLFRIYGVDLLYGLTYPLQVIRAIIALPSRFTLFLSDQILKRFYDNEEDLSEKFLTRSELEQFIKTSMQEEDESVDTEMLQRAMKMKETKVRDCMVPRTEIVSIEISEPISALEQLFESSKLSKILVYREDIDHVMGYVHHRQMLEKPKSIEEALIEIVVVPEVMAVRKLMKSFIKKGSSIACVVDEFGGTSGIITLEDILEELFGEIEDEYDEEEEIEKQLSDNEFLFSGRLEVSYINDKYEELEIPEGDYNTLSGFAIQQLQEIPEEGQIFESEDYIFIIYSVSKKKIELIKVRKKEKN
jgi:CBS domain containing-hemolysin-like protein